MQSKNLNSESLEYFLGLGKDIIPETKDFLFRLMEETAIEENRTRNFKEDRIFLISQLHRLLTGFEKEFLNQD